MAVDPSTHQDSPKVPERALDAAVNDIVAFIGEDADWLRRELRQFLEVGIENAALRTALCNEERLQMRATLLAGVGDNLVDRLDIERLLDPPGESETYIPVSALLSDEVLSRVLGELEVLGWQPEADEAEAVVDLRSALTAAIEHVGGPK